MSWSTSNGSYGSNLRPKQYNPPFPSKYTSSNSTSKNSNEPIGLRNLGNTCYISAVLQVLFMILSQKDFPVKNKDQIITQAFFELKKSRKTEYYRNLKEVIEDKIEIVQGTEQQDSQQLFIRLIQEIGYENLLPRRSGKVSLDYKSNMTLKENLKMYLQEMEKLEKNNIIKIFSGQTLSEYKCRNCKHPKYKFDRFNAVSLYFKKEKSSTISSFYYDRTKTYSLDDLLRQNFEPEEVDGLLCQKCKTKTFFDKKSSLYKLPKILVIHFSRFKTGYYTNEKITAQIMFDDFLSLVEQGKYTIKYKLFGIVHHWGTLNRGHYYADVKVGDTWYEVDDETVKETRVKSINNVSKSVYMLFYQRMP